MKIYIAGKITGLTDYKEVFAEAEAQMIAQGHSVMNPAGLNAGFGYEDYMKICFSMIDVCDGIFMINNWSDSDGAKRELKYAIEQCKNVYLDTAIDCIELSDYHEPTGNLTYLNREILEILRGDLCEPLWKSNRDRDGRNLTDKFILCVQSRIGTYTMKCHISLWQDVDATIYTHAPDEHIFLSGLSELETIVNR